MATTATAVAPMEATAAPAGAASSALMKRKLARRRDARRAEGAPGAVDAHASHADAPDAGASDAAGDDSGAPLPDGVRHKFEGSLGADLSGVRVHTGEASAASAGGLGARAYATGQDIHFNAGQYDPSSTGGQQLLAHEVAHTVQQSAAGAPSTQAKLEVSTPGDAHEHEADRAAGAMVRGEPARVSPATGISRMIMREALGTKPPDPTATDPADALTTFKSKLTAKKVVDKDALAAWTALADKTNVDEGTIMLAIDKLAAPAAHQIVKECGRGFSAGIVGEIVKVKRGWHDELKDQAQAIAAAPDSDPMKKLSTIVQASAAGSQLLKYGYKPQLASATPSGTTLALGKPYVLPVTDQGAVRMHTNMPALEQPQLSWRLEADDKILGAPAPEASPPPGPEYPTKNYTFTPKQAGTTNVTVEVTAFCKDGLIGTSKQTFALTVYDTATNATGYFDARFKEELKPVVASDAFKAYGAPAAGASSASSTAEAAEIAAAAAGSATPAAKPQTISSLFTADQQKQLLGYMDSKLVPVGLFTNNTSNMATGPQRVLIAAHMLTFGKIKMSDGDVDGKTWAASCCGGWVNGVYAYAGVNFAKGYGVNSKEQSVSPTGEKSYGSGGQGDAADPASNKQVAEVAALNKQIADQNKVIKGDGELEAAAKKSGDTAGAADAAGHTAADKAKLQELQQGAMDAKVAAGSSPYGIGARNMDYDYFEAALKPGDWVYIDNNGAAGHSVIFVGWAEDKKADTEPDTQTALANLAGKWNDKPDTQNAIAAETKTPRAVTSRLANVYNQPNAGGSYNTTRLGFPESRALGVDGVYAITHAREDAQVASTADQFLAFNVDTAKAANQKTMDSAKVDSAAVKAKLLPIVQAIVADVNAGKHARPDKVGRVAGGLSEPQRRIVDGILKGSGDDAIDIASLVAVGQKLSVLDMTQGDPGQPNGKLETSMQQYWKAPFPAWSKDDTLKRH